MMWDYTELIKIAERGISEKFQLGVKNGRRLKFTLGAAFRIILVDCIFLLEQDFKILMLALYELFKAKSQSLASVKLISPQKVEDLGFFCNLFIEYIIILNASGSRVVSLFR